MTDPLPKRQSPSAAPVDFEAVFRTEIGWVLATLRRYGVHDADLEDVAHDVFVVFYRKLDQFDPARSLRAWLGGIAHRVASDHRKRAHVRRETAQDPIDPVDPRPPPEESLDAARARALVREALADVEEQRRPVLVLHDIDGLPMSEIAAALDLPINTAYSRLRLARADFRRAVDRRRGGAR